MYGNTLTVFWNVFIAWFHTKIKILEKKKHIFSSFSNKFPIYLIGYQFKLKCWPLRRKASKNLKNFKFMYICLKTFHTEINDWLSMIQCGKKWLTRKCPNFVKRSSFQVIGTNEKCVCWCCFRSSQIYFFEMWWSLINWNVCV